MTEYEHHPDYTVVALAFACDQAPIDTMLIPTA